MEPNELADVGPVVRVFGGMGVDLDGEPISIGGPRQRRLLALLAIRAGSVLSNDWLEENLWNDDERPEGSVIALRTSVSRLRTALGDVGPNWIQTDHGGYVFTAPADAIEHQRFARLRAEATRARDLDDPLTALGFLDDALGSWRGQPFRELDDLDWARGDIEQLSLDRQEMLEERWEAALALGRHTQITGELAAFTAEHALRDRAARQYALALHRSGRTVEALRVIAEHRRAIADVGGLDPSPAIVELEAALLAGDESLQIDKIGRPLRGYRLLEEVGSGAFSVVWRGVQPSVEREVAIKQIRPELASRPEFIRRFEAEARMVARIEHPHIVPLIDFWRDPDSAYLVMRWLRGGTLERRLDDGALSVDEAVSMARQIGDALTAAHGHGIVHRDVKAANVLFDEQGNAFLADFGIALEATESGGAEAALSQGSPAYASPEQLRRQPLGPEADVFSLGVVLFESLAGSLPFPANESLDELVEKQLNDPIPSLSEFRPDLPPSMIEAIATATAKDPADRYGSVQEFLQTFVPSNLVEDPPPRAASGDTATRTADDAISNPYVGLRPFDDGDADRFFGRESLVDELVRRLDGHSVTSRCVVVVGPSGSGKSSVVRAGLMPALRAGAVDGSSEWFTTTMVPGTDPFESMEAALLRIAVNPPPSLVEQLREGKRGILRSVRRCLTSDADRVVVVIDQFEEIFTGSSTEDADQFLDALSVAVEDPVTPLRLVVTLRADYYDRPLEHPAFARILSDATVTATPLAADELERAIVEPVRRVGVHFEPGLAARLAAEAYGQPSPLPLLQYTLSELFDHRVGDEMTLAAHDEIGGVAGALASRAEALYAAADDAERLAIRRVFGRLINPSEESADLRRRVRVVDLEADPLDASVIQRFGAARLVTFDRETSTREPTVEVAHEALLREWPRLADWLLEDADLLRSVEAISAAATTWEESGREATDLYRGGRLENAVAVAVTAPQRLRPVDHEFVDASRRADDASRREEQRRVRRLRRLVGATALGLVIALVAGGFALRAQRRAESATDQAELATLISRSAAASADEPELSVLLALEAHRSQPGTETEQAVFNALGSSAIVNSVASHPWPFDPDCDFYWDSGGDIGLFGVANGQLATLDTLSGTVTEHGASPEPCVPWVGDEDLDRRFVLSPDFTRMVVGPFDGPDEIEVELNGPLRGLFHGRPAAEVVVVEGEGRLVTRFDITTGERLSERTTVDDGQYISGNESGDGSRIALSYQFVTESGVAGLTLLLDGATTEEVARIETSIPLPWLAFDDADGALIAAAPDGTIFTIDSTTGEIVDTVNAQAAGFFDLAALPDGRVLAVSPGQAEVIDRRAGPVGRPIELSNLAGARIRDDGLVMTLDAERDVDVIDLNGNGLISETYEIGPFSSVTIGDDVAATTDLVSREVELIDLSTGERTPVELLTPEGDRFPAEQVVPDDTGVWALGAGNVVARWEGGRMVERTDLDGRSTGGVLHRGRYGSLTFDDDGSATAQLLDLGGDRLDVPLQIAVPGARAAHPTADGGLYVMSGDGILQTYGPDGALRSEIETGVDDPRAIAIDPMSGRLAVGGSGVAIVDPISGEVETLRQVDVVWSLGFAKGGALLTIGSTDGTIRVWDVQRGESAGIAWRGTGQRVSIPNQDDPEADSLWVTTGGALLEVPLDPELWIERACFVVDRDLTQAEWDLFVPGGGEVQSACG